jgi:hypothetical protein
MNKKASIYYCRVVVLISLFFILISAIGQPVRSGAGIFVPLNVTNVDGNSLNVEAGDTLYIESGERDHLRFANLSGDSLNRIIIINAGGLVNINTFQHYYGIQFYNCKYFKFTGTGDPTYEYGFRVSRTPPKANGVSLDGNSSDFEIEHIEISNTGFAGIFSLTQPDCNGKSTRGNYVMKNTSYHHNYIHDTSGEALYIGHSYFTGYTVSCGGKDTVLLPHEIKNIKIYDNIVERSGYDGIQIGCATENCEVYSNKITNYGMLNLDFQKSGIVIGGGTTGKCYNNYISNGTGNGINVFGLGNNLIYNNIIVYPGYNIELGVPQYYASYGIFCDDRSTIPGRSFNFVNNTIIGPGSDGIRIYSRLSANNRMYNNLILSPGSLGKYNLLNQSYIYVNPGVDVRMNNNFFSYHLSPYVDYGNYDELYEYGRMLDVNNKGRYLDEFDISEDFRQNDRVLNGVPDIGAIEYQSEQMKQPLEMRAKVYALAGTKELVVDNLYGDKIYNISLYQVDGKQLFTTDTHETNDRMLQYNLSNLKGIFFVKITTKYTVNTHKVFFN